MMKIVSEEHFKDMQMMCQYFETRSKVYADSLPEFEAAKAINDIIANSTNPNASDFKEIENILTNVDKVRHKNDSHWYDYKIHVVATLRANGYKAGFLI